jgi:hypothetical protein
LSLRSSHNASSFRERQPQRGFFYETISPCDHQRTDFLAGTAGMTEDTGTVRTEGRTVNVGRRTATAEARISDTKGRLLAHATTTCLVFEIPKA